MKEKFYLTKIVEQIKVCIFATEKNQNLYDIRYNMNNTLTAIISIVKNIDSTYNLRNRRDTNNRMNQMGEALEDYIQDAFADCLGADIRVRHRERARVFSYLGNSKNPPDAMIKGGDAIEIKKIETLGKAQMQLNSSYPKNKLYIDCDKITSECKTCEQWLAKDMLYAVGYVKNNDLKALFFIYGDLYCDERIVYERVENVIREGLDNLQDVDLADTDELGRVNNVDHLGISDLRIRGMWLIKTPFKHFQYLTQIDKQKNFSLIALIPEDKYNSFDNKNEFEEECKTYGISISDEEIQDPKNPANLLNAKLITFYSNGVD